MYNSLLDEDLLVFSKTAATIIGLNESIVLHQIHYWLNNIEKSENEEYKMYHQHCGRFWVYNTFEQWHDQFPYWSVITIKRIFKSLEDKHLLITGNFNKKGYDRTKWYTIDYDTVKTLEKSHSINMIQCKVSDCDSTKYQPDTTNTIDYPKTSDKKFIKSIIRFSPEKRETDYGILRSQIQKAYDQAFFKNNVSFFQEIICYFFSEYHNIFNEYHPNIKTSQLKEIMLALDSDISTEYGVVDYLESDDYIYLIDCYFENEFPSCPDCDYHINHFVSPGILEILYCKHIKCFY